MALPSPRDPDATAAALARWLTAEVGAPVGVTEVGGPPATGFSNETILFTATWDDGAGPVAHPLVARVRPTSHTVFPDDQFEVQHRVMAALQGQSGLSVPPQRWFEDDPSTLGAPFMVMEQVEGVAPSDNPPYAMEGWLKDAGPDVQRAVWERGLDAMAAVHRVDWRALGLEDLDPCPDGGSRNAHRLDAWEAMLRWASPEEQQVVPEMAIAWLRATLPPDAEPALCWGDSRISNQLFSGIGDAEQVRVAAVLDWEMVHVGDPVSDLGWFTWLDHTLSSGLDLPRLPGLPSVEATVARWEEATGRSGEHHRWHELVAGLGFAVVMVRLTELLKDSGILPTVSDFARTNMACVALERALAELGVVASPPDPEAP